MHLFSKKNVSFFWIGKRSKSFKIWSLKNIIKILPSFLFLPSHEVITMITLLVEIIIYKSMSFIEKAASKEKKQKSWDFFQ